MELQKGVGGTPDLHSWSVGVTSGDLDLQLAFWGGEQSCGPEPLTCGVFANLDSVRVELTRSSTTPCPLRFGELLGVEKRARLVSGVWIMGVCAF